MSPPRTGRPLAAIALGLGLGCRPGDAPTAPPTLPDAAVALPAGPRFPKPPPDAPFTKIQALLAEPTTSERRARELYPLVDGICASPEARKAFVEHAAGAAADNGAARVEAIEVVEHVATACHRGAAAVGTEILTLARAVLVDPFRLDIIAARFLAAEGRLVEAKDAAARARDAGSVHAIALYANLEADLARSRTATYAKGMFDAAIAAVSVEPDHGSALIDLAAVLTTRARLLEERAVWEDGEARLRTLADARASLVRLAQAPFPARIRALHLDLLCFDSVETGDPDHFLPCTRAMRETGNLGAAFLVGAPEKGPSLDLERARKIQELRQTLDRWEKDAVVAVVIRGDDAELAAWLRPLVEVLKLVYARRARIVVVDRSADDRGAALVDRAIALAAVRPRLRLDGRRQTTLLPCVAALAAGKPAPKSCPLAAADQKRLAGLGAIRLGVLVGRDLDAEIDDLSAHGVPRLLLSLREPSADRTVDAHLINLAEAWMFSPAAVDLEAKLEKKRPPEADAR